MIPNQRTTAYSRQIQQAQSLRVELLKLEAHIQYDQLEIKAREQQEREILAQLQHLHQVTLPDLGSASGQSPKTVLEEQLVQLRRELFPLRWRLQKNKIRRQSLRKILAYLIAQLRKATVNAEPPHSRGRVVPNFQAANPLRELRQQPYGPLRMVLPEYTVLMIVAILVAVSWGALQFAWYVFVATVGVWWLTALLNSLK